MTDMPNRVSVDDNDPGYAEVFSWRVNNPGFNILVLLDGVELKFVQTADRVEGFVTFTKQDERGRPAIDWTNPDDPEWAQETRHGKVEFQAIARPPR